MRIPGSVDLADHLAQTHGGFPELGNPFTAFLHVPGLQPLQALGSRQPCYRALGPEVVLVDHIHGDVDKLHCVSSQVELLGRVRRSGHPGTSCHSISQEQREQPVQVVVNIMSHDFIIISVLQPALHSVSFSSAK